MTTAVAAPRVGFKFMLLVKEGPDKGASYQLLPPKVTIGRNPDNHVVLTDPRVSRQAIAIEFTMEKITATDLSSRKALIVGGETTSEASIKDGDVLRIGDTEMIFMVEAIPLQTVSTASPSHSPVSTSPMSAPTSAGGGTAILPFPPPGAGAPAPFPSAQQPSPGMSGLPPYTAPRQPRYQGGSDNSGKLRFYVIVGIGVGVLVWLLNSKPPEKPPEAGPRTVEQIEQDLKDSGERQEAITKKRTFKSDEEKTRFEEAQKHYLEGFRDYQKGQYIRSMKSFETARAIDPDHEMARRYYKLAERQRDEMIAFLTLEGKRYREKSMFSRCSAALEKVLDAIPDKEDLKYKEAESLKKECDLLIDERFQ